MILKFNPVWRPLFSRAPFDLSCVSQWCAQAAGAYCSLWHFHEHALWGRLPTGGWALAKKQPIIGLFAAFKFLGVLQHSSVDVLSWVLVGLWSWLF